MAIDRLSGTAGLIAALRAEMSSKADRSGRKAPSHDVLTTHTAKPRPDLAALKKDLSRILNEIDASDRSAVDEVRPRVVRAVLLWEFGPELREHPQWQPMLDRITSTIAASEGHHEALAQMIRELRGL